MALPEHHKCQSVPNRQRRRRVFPFLQHFDRKRRGNPLTNRGEPTNDDLDFQPSHWTVSSFPYILRKVEFTILFQRLIEISSGLAVTSYPVGTSGSNPVCEIYAKISLSGVESLLYSSLSRVLSAAIPTKSSRLCKVAKALIEPCRRIHPTCSLIPSKTAGRAWNSTLRLSCLFT